MTTYIIKRLFLMAITLFGICLVSFLVINLAPGDPADQSSAGSGMSNQAVSDFVLRKNRERLFLDKPILFNTSPSDRNSTLATLIENLTSDSEYVVNETMKYGALNDFGVTAIPAIVVELKSNQSLSDLQRKQLLEALTKVAKLWPDEDKSDPRYSGDLKARSEAWVKWWSENESRFSDAEVAAKQKAFLESWDKFKAANPGEDLIARFISSEDAAYAKPRQELLSLGKFHVPSLMAKYQSQSGQALQLTATTLSMIVGKSWDLTIDSRERRGFESRWENEADQILSKISDAIAADGGTKKFDLKAKGKSLSEVYAATNAVFDGFPNSASVRKAVRVSNNLLKRLGTREQFLAAKIATTKSDHVRGWRNWWARRADNFLVYSSGKTFVRMFTDTRFGYWFSNLIRLDFGESYTTNRPVMEMIGDNFMVTFKMNITSILLTYLIAIPLGIYSATNQYSVGDRLTTVALFVLYSLPTFWVGTMMIWLLTGPPYLDWFPSSHAHSPDFQSYGFFEYYFDEMWHLALPVMCLTYGGVAYISRQMRAGMLETVRQDYIRTARAKGLSEKVVIMKHAVRNSMIPILTLIANLLPLMIGGSVIIEEIFSIQGLGKLSFEAVLNRDYPVIMTIFTLSGLLTLVGILVSDILYAIVDPRISYN